MPRLWCHGQTIRFDVEEAQMPSACEIAMPLLEEWVNGASFGIFRNTEIRGNKVILTQAVGTKMFVAFPPEWISHAICIAINGDSEESIRENTRAIIKQFELMCDSWRKHKCPTS
jgi:hypothetical protein